MVKRCQEAQAEATESKKRCLRAEARAAELEEKLENTRAEAEAEKQLLQVQLEEMGDKLRVSEEERINTNSLHQANLSRYKEILQEHDRVLGIMQMYDDQLSAITR